MSSNSKVEIFTDLSVDDKNIELGDKYDPTDAGADGGGITLRGTTEKTFNWVLSTTSWTSSENLELASGKVFRINGNQVLSATSLGSGVSVPAENISGTIPSSVFSNSSFYIGTTQIGLNRASANQTLTGITSITLPGTTSGSVLIRPETIAGTNTTITFPAKSGTVALLSDLVSSGNVESTSANTPSTIVARDSSGNFAAGTITASLSGNASTATSLATSRSIWGQSFDGSASISGNISSVGTITGTSALGLYSGGSNQDLTLNPSGTGKVISNALLSHNGLHFTVGTEVDQIKVFTKSLTLSTDWQDTGIAGEDLKTGTYAIQLFANDTGAGGTNNNEYYSGMVSWYEGSTSSSLEMPTDEISLHRSGASGDGALYLRTFRTNSGYLKLQVYSNTANNSSSNYVFKFRRLI